MAVAKVVNSHNYKTISNEKGIMVRDRDNINMHVSVKMFSDLCLNIAVYIT